MELRPYVCVCAPVSNSWCFFFKETSRNEDDGADPTELNLTESGGRSGEEAKQAALQAVPEARRHSKNKRHGKQHDIQAT